MIISGATKISKIIEENKEAISVIAEINSNFKKLKNPILRKILASRVSVNDAARIGKVTAEVILKKLEGIGFEVNFETKNSSEGIHLKENNIKSNKMIINKEKVVKLDVRPILDSGVDPFHAILAKLKEIGAEENLCIINSFEPIPLLNILKGRGYSYEVERDAEGIVYTYLSKTGDAEPNLDSLSAKDVVLNFEDIERKFEGKMTEIDVRDLEMPQPMVTILEALEQLEAGKALFVHHKRLPQYLLPELEKRAYNLVSKHIDELNTKLIIFK